MYTVMWKVKLVGSNNYNNAEYLGYQKMPL